MPEFEEVIEPVIIFAQVEGDENERKKKPIRERVKNLLIESADG